ncbi:CGNR zinc finger domain-containing protein [Winogradskya consettensis]|uniref:Zinc finger CGNR domain-containing protein n=1 Tax=Winogradskya consettensis TaxID=113560 RepID=A0A919SZ91_9ACTN|nr:ABATE domain-containing protein [Actinoplanes consettensis]GIM81398.1 hypothetical protein Aco04nite_76380 [Actinoplanes consettensis]
MSFVFVSGRPSLDFAGTLKWRRRAQGEEQLSSPADLASWASSASLGDIPAGPANFAAAISAREAIYRVIRSRLDGAAPAATDVTLINSLARGPRLTPTLLADGQMTRTGTTEELLATLAADLLDLLSSDEIDRVKGCANSDCTRLYLDASRLGNRQWCGMAECGNRAKVSAFRARRRTSAN